MLRVVLDTNVLISALAFRGETKKIWDLAVSKQFFLFTSAFILSESFFKASTFSRHGNS